MFGLRLTSDDRNARKRASHPRDDRCGEEKLDAVSDD